MMTFDQLAAEDAALVSKASCELIQFHGADAVLRLNNMAEAVRGLLRRGKTDQIDLVEGKPRPVWPSGGCRGAGSQGCHISFRDPICLPESTGGVSMDRPDWIGFIKGLRAEQERLRAELRPYEDGTMR